MASWDECEYEGEVESEDSERAITQMDPLELRFSQRKMRNVFADGKLIADSVNQVRPVRRTLEEQNIYGAPWRLEAPFPAIEVLRFRCKLRDETTGRPLLDPVTKKEMFEEESWFTLDNRRLYCLQRVAVDLLPERCTVDTVAEIRKERRLREIRKFRTLDGGRSINVGSVVDGVPFETWSWEEARSEDRQKSKGHKGKEGKEGKEGKDAKSGSKGKSGKGGKGKDKGRRDKLQGVVAVAGRGRVGHVGRASASHGASVRSASMRDMGWQGGVAASLLGSFSGTLGGQLRICSLTQEGQAKVRCLQACGWGFWLVGQLLGQVAILLAPASLTACVTFSGSLLSISALALRNWSQVGAG
ncbi:unnamed protein product [Effrenium voratum]|uniref:Uncharacterized protein n=1 Tax=Effrenium voratum TaxID=2562239 RepID=A0AA36J8M8_9DINO|nr:unnamed protein product [Effrenium voratum]